MTYRSEVDIANRALQHCGAARIGSDGFNEDSKNASECAFAYDKVRRAELRRSTWNFSVKHCVMRPLADDTRLLAPALWSSLTTYFTGSLVSDNTGAIWQSTVPGNLNNALGVSNAWEPYCGPIAVFAWDTTGGTTYYRGELVYTYTGDGTAKVYLSLENDNADNPATVTAYDATKTYRKDAVVVSASVNYQSLIDLNKGQTPASSPAAWTTSLTRPASSGKWLDISALVALQEINTRQPLEFGPGMPRSVFMLPNNFLRMVKQAPKAGAVSYLGSPGQDVADDRLVEGNFITTGDATPFLFRFVADMTWVLGFDAMFCEGLASRLALEVCEILTQSGSKLGTIKALYDECMGEARIVNAVDTGPTEDAVDDWIACRS